jgi:uncharacterized membrane protein YuzA (DUF378 family)
MNKPPPNHPPAGSNVLTYLVVAGVGLAAFGFLYLLFGELFLLAMVIFALIGGVGCLHYVLWGRAMSEEARKRPAEAEQPE